MICWWIYAPEDGGEVVIIGSLHTAPPGAGAMVLKHVETSDREQAEEWRQALAKGEIPNHDPVASALTSLRRAQREGMSLNQLAQRYRREPEMAQLVEILRSEAAAAQTVAAEGAGAD